MSRKGSDTKLSMTSTPSLPPLSAPVSSPAETGWKGGREPRYNYNIQQPGMFPPGAGNCPVKLSDLGNLGEFVRIPDLANLKQTEYLSTQNFPLSMDGRDQRRDGRFDVK